MAPHQAHGRISDGGPGFQSHGDASRNEIFLRFEREMDKFGQIDNLNCTFLN